MNIPDTSNVLLRWTLGRQDTVALSEYDEARFLDFLWLAKLSVVSFQNWFPKARFVVLLNGDGYEELCNTFDSISPDLRFPVEYMNQKEMLQGEVENPYHFYPAGVWWKWVPFRLDNDKFEIAIDTDILCLSRPDTWYQWIEQDEEIIIAPERYKKVAINTTGDFYSHPLLVDKKPFNCGIVGQRAGVNFEERFFEVTKSVEFGHTHNSLFITEQGAINLWIRSLEIEGVRHYCLDFGKNAWMRDFVYFLHRGVKVETLHAVTWYKKIAKGLKGVFEARIIDGRYDDKGFLEAILKAGLDLEFISKYVLGRQLADGQLDNEILIPKTSF